MSYSNPINKSRICFYLCVLFLALTKGAFADAWKVPFRNLNIEDGLSSCNVQCMIELMDGRIAISTLDNINIYDGVSLRYIHQGANNFINIPNFTGHCHLYEDKQAHLWIKNYPQKLSCFDLHTYKYVENFDSILRYYKINTPIEDLFCDDNHGLWILERHGILRCVDRPLLRIKVPHHQSVRLQDLVLKDNKVYLFYSNSKVECYNAADGRFLYSSQALKKQEVKKYQNTSLLMSVNRRSTNNDPKIQTCTHYIYQLRCGDSQSIWLRFDTKSRRWKTILAVNGYLHTLSIGNQHAFVTSPNLLYILDLKDEHLNRVESLSMENGSKLSSGRMGTVLATSDGGLWLGAYDKGIFYSHPCMIQKNTGLLRFRPILSHIIKNGELLQCGTKELPKAENFTKELSFTGIPRKLTLQFAAQNYYLPTLTTYYYRVLGSTDTCWHEASCGNGEVDEKGMLSLNLSDLSYGNYTVQVMAGKSWQSKLCQLDLHIHHPWYHIAFFILLIMACLTVGLWFFLRRRKKQPTIENEKIAELPSTELTLKAMNLIESHLTTPNYGVEQLSKDLCMERTGLYKKLVSQSGKTPSAFIKEVRIKNALKYLLEGYSVQDVSVKVGFSSPSHLIKAFQEKYGCTPTAYIKNQH